MDINLADQLTVIMATSTVQVTMISVVLLSILAVSSFTARVTFNNLAGAFGTNCVVYTTGWLGTPIHEISHLLACWAFRMKVVEVKLFEPDYQSMSLGYVKYSFNKSSVYQRVGCFFVGLAPLAGGMGMILALAWLLIPGFQTLLVDLVSLNPDEPVEGFTGYLGLAADAFLQGIRLVISPSNWTSWQLWIFIYITVCISCHLTPSRSDLQGIAPGILTLIMLIIIGNTIATVLGYDPKTYTAYFGNYLGIIASLFGITLGISMVISLLVSFIAVPIRIFK